VDIVLSETVLVL